MAKSFFEIQMDRAKAMNQAGKLDDIAKEIRNAANRDFQDSISRISSNWSSESATAYIKKCETLKREILKTANSVERTAATVRTIADNIYRAELASIQAVES